MSRASVLARGRVAAEAGMVDTCTIRRRDPDAEVTDPVTGVITAPYLPGDIYSGKCRVQRAQALAQQHDAGEDHILLRQLIVQLPIAAVGLKVGDEVTVTASAHDPDEVGRNFLVRDVEAKSEATVRRLQCTERTD